jgi:hypothetical protein
MNIAIIALLMQIVVAPPQEANLDRTATRRGLSNNASPNTRWAARKLPVATPRPARVDTMGQWVPCPELERDPRTGEMGDDPIHIAEASRRMALTIGDISAVWDRESGTVSLEIAARVLVNVDSCDHFTASTVLLSAADVEARPVEFRVPTYKNIEIPGFASFAGPLDSE